MGSRPEHVRTTTYCALMEITTGDKSSACAMLESGLINKEVLRVDPAGRSCGDVPRGAIPLWESGRRQLGAHLRGGTRVAAAWLCSQSL